MEIFGIPTQALFGQLLIGLINGAFYAMLSLGLAVIFGLLNIINFTHGAQYMMGAFCAWFLLEQCGHRLLVGARCSRRSSIGATGVVIERHDAVAALQARPSLRTAADLRPGARSSRGCSRNYYGSSGQPYRLPDEFAGACNLGLHVPAEVPRAG
mgnify:CR=1 FL=1